MLTEYILFSCYSFVFAHSGKAGKDESTKSEAEVKNTTAEVKTVPNEAPQANGNESKA